LICSAEEAKKPAKFLSSSRAFAVALCVACGIWIRARWLDHRAALRDLAKEQFTPARHCLAASAG
jgi:NMD protein affecting ribosome stability and mRNA decay